MFTSSPKDAAVAVLIMILPLLSHPGIAGEQPYPPWTEPPPGGVRFTVPCIDNVPDLHGEVEDPDLVVFFGGNQFMVLPQIMEAFRSTHPQHQRIFYETLPPGILEQQLATGSLVVGNLKITHEPDVFVAGEQRLRDLDEKHGCFSDIVPYFRNSLAIMIRAGNPKDIQSLVGLGRADVAVSMPNPQTEGIAQKAMEALEKAGGAAVVDAVMDRKVELGTTFITRIHHRQTPMRIMDGASDAGPVWRTEALFQQRIGNPIAMVEIPEPHNVSGTTAAGLMSKAAHGQAARDFVDFLRSPRAQAIYAEYGFEPIAP